MPDSPTERWIEGDPDPFDDAAAFRESIGGRAARMQKDSAELLYEVRDAAGKLVRLAPQVITTDDSGSTYIEYHALSDLPLGEYTIHPGAIKVNVVPDMKP